MKPGDLVKMKRGYSPPGIVLAILPRKSSPTMLYEWVRILWPDHGVAAEKKTDLEVVNEIP